MGSERCVPLDLARLSACYRRRVELDCRSASEVDETIIRLAFEHSDTRSRERTADKRYFHSGPPLDTCLRSKETYPCTLILISAASEESGDGRWKPRARRRGLVERTRNTPSERFGPFFADLARTDVRWKHRLVTARRAGGIVKAVARGRHELIAWGEMTKPGTPSQWPQRSRYDFLVLLLSPIKKTSKVRPLLHVDSSA